MPWDTLVTGLVEHPSWEPFLRRLESCESDFERLAVCGELLAVVQQLVRSALSPKPWVPIEAVDVGDLGPIEPALAAIGATSDDGPAAAALVTACTILDRTLRLRLDEHRSSTGEVEVHWGPFHGIHAGSPLHVIRWHRDPGLPVDQQGLVPKALANFRVLGPAAGGFEWDFEELGGRASQPRSRLRRSLLGRDQWPLRIAVWPGTEVDPGEFRLDDGCLIAAPAESVADRLLDDAKSAVGFAEAERAHMLVLPELYLPAQHLAAVQALLARDDRQAYPIITVAGLSHQGLGRGWVNRAVVLDHTGEEIATHHKSAAFGDRSGASECLEVGSSLGMWHTAAGWLMVLICLDLFATDSRQALVSAAPNLLLAPSLSAKTSAHENAVDQAKAIGTASVVTNRPYLVAPEVAPSIQTCSTSSPKRVLDRTIVTWHPPG